MPITYMGTEYPFIGLGKNYYNYSDQIEFETYLGEMFCKDPELKEFLREDEESAIFDELVSHYQNKANFNKQEIEQMLESNLTVGLNTMEDFDKCFTDLKKETKKMDFNFIYYTAVMDFWNHKFSKISIITYYYFFRLQRLLKGLMPWILKNQDYVLIVSSDHGGMQDIRFPSSF